MTELESLPWFGDVNARGRRAILDLGIHTLEQLTNTPVSRFLWVKYFGRKSLRDLREILDYEGLSLLGDAGWRDRRGDFVCEKCGKCVAISNGLAHLARHHKKEIADDPPPVIRQGHDDETMWQALDRLLEDGARSLEWIRKRRAQSRC